MKTWQKVGIGVGGTVVLVGIVLFSINQANKGVVTVQTAKVAPQETLVSQVTASGEIKPTTYTNVTAQGFGRITGILVKEGDKVKKGDRLLLQENIQASADVQAQAASINSAEAGSRRRKPATGRRKRISCCNRLTWRRPSWTGNGAKVYSRTA